jgi:hypothetical protein
MSALASALPALISLARRRRVDGLSTYVTAMTLTALAVSLLPGSTHVLLAKEAVLTGTTGLWFFAGTRARRPLIYLASRPLLEGRFRWPSDWEQLWQASPRFRHMWRTASAVWGIGLLIDAGLRVVLAWTLPPRVPALATALYVVTLVVLNLVTHAWYAVCGVHDPRSPLRRSADDAPDDPVRPLPQRGDRSPGGATPVAPDSGSRTPGPSATEPAPAPPMGQPDTGSAGWRARFPPPAR